jgi:hypothetical protein
VNVVCMHATLIVHCVTHFVGQRTVLSLTAKTDAKSVKKHGNDMTADEQAELDKEHGAKLAKRDDAVITVKPRN